MRAGGKHLDQIDRRARMPDVFSRRPAMLHWIAVLRGNVPNKQAKISHKWSLTTGNATPANPVLLILNGYRNLLVTSYISSRFHNARACDGINYHFYYGFPHCPGGFCKLSHWMHGRLFGSNDFSLCFSHCLHFTPAIWWLPPPACHMLHFI